MRMNGKTFVRVCQSAAVGLALTSFGFADELVDENHPSVQAAKAHFQERAAEYGLENPAAELQFRRGRVTDAGWAHIRMDQYYQGVPVFGGEVVAHIRPDGGIWVRNRLRVGQRVAVTPSIRENRAVVIAARAGSFYGAYETERVELMVLPANSKGIGNADARLVWHVRLWAENNVDLAKQWDVFVDAATGDVVRAFDTLHTSVEVATGKTMWSGDVDLTTWLGFTGTYSLLDIPDGRLTTRDLNHGTSGKGTVVRSSTSTFGDGDKNNTDDATAAADAHFGAMTSWAYYGDQFGRNGIDGNGRRTYSRVHYGFNYQNAFWNDSCFCMTYGDGGSTFYTLTSLDVAGHEMSHGVMSTEADMNYFGESGGLNESSSDIFGTMIEFYANSSEDAPEYWIGERIYRSNWPTDDMYVENFALRYMDNPPQDGVSPACWYNGIGNIDVHYSSGPNNHMFYLLAEGGVSQCNADSVTGIGREKAAAIWYKAISDYSGTTTDYHDVRQDCLDAATELYGAGSPEYNAVDAAYAAIDVQ